MAASNQRPHQYTYDPDGYIKKVKGFHQANYDSVLEALRHANQQLRKSIASSSNSELTNTRLYSMLLSVWCEARLHVLLYEVGAFNEVQRANIYNSDSVELRWKEALHVAVVKNAGLNAGVEINEENVDFSLFNIFNRINELITKYFSSVIRNRNKVAHAQWVTPFTNLQGTWENSSSFSVCETTKTDFQTDNLLTLELKAKLLQSIAVAINNIAVDSNAYKAQDFDTLYKQILFHEKSLANVNFTTFKSSIQKSFQENRT